MDVQKIKELIKALEESTVGEIIIEEGESRISLRKSSASASETQASLVREGAKSAAPEEAIEPAAITSNGDRGGWKSVTAPMVGTFYATPSPDAEPYVKVGDTVSAGQTLCILEAMKLMNEITAEESGTIKETCIENGKPVQFGQALFYYE